MGTKISLYLDDEQTKKLNERIEEFMANFGLARKESVSVSGVIQAHLEASYRLPLKEVYP